MSSPVRNSVLSVKLDPILSQIIDAFARAKPQDRLEYLNKTMNLIEFLPRPKPSR